MRNHATACDPTRRVAVVGAACRLPGARDVDEFWQVLSEGRSTVGRIPADRFPVERWYAPEPEPGRIVSRAGGFLPAVDRFDAAFFRMSPYEAERTDPQHRLLLELTREALDDAGIPAGSLAGSRTGVYTCALATDYWDLLRAGGATDLHAAMGAGSWGIPAGRIAHHLDLRGPTMGVEAACSTSLLAVHLAVTALRMGQIDLALVGSAHLLLGPDHYFPLSAAQILSPSGRCRFGDADADGYVRSEGAVTLVLKPLDTALADGDRVYATVVGTAANNNGMSAGTLTATSRQAQVDLVAEALRSAGLRAADLDYVEAHGPGTPAGDAVELAALSQVMADRAAGRPCLLGSVKSNLGHTEVSAGLVGLLKTALALRHRTVPATLHVRTPRPEVAGPDGPLRLATGSEPWPVRPDGGPARAGVSSFGLGGSNAHVVLEEAPPASPAGAPAGPADTGAVHLLPVSARSAAALHALTVEVADLAGGAGGQVEPPDPADLSHSAAARRSHHPHRLCAVYRDCADLSRTLWAYVRQERPATLVVGEEVARLPPRVVFLFSGHGSQWVGMGRGLLRDTPTFARALHECAGAVRAELGWDLVDRLQDDRPLEGVVETQPVLWAMQVALAAVWRDWGVEPELVLGQSMGEVAAAVVSGALDVAQGAAVICRRAVLLSEHAEPGAMWAVSVGAQRVHDLVGPLDERVAVAVRTGPHACVLSGATDALEELTERLTDRGVSCHRVRVDYASHAPHVEPLRVPLAAALADLEPAPGRVPLHSTALLRPLTGGELDAGYWMDNLRRPVGLHDALRAVLAGDRPTLVVEIGPHPLLLSAVEDVAAELGATAAAVPSLFQGRSEREALLTALAEAYALGCDPDWSRVCPPGRFVPLPAYPWQGTSHWIAPAVTAPRDTERDTEPERPPPRSFGDLRRSLAAQVCAALGMAPQQLDPAEPLSHSGLDSVLAVQVSHRLGRELGVHLPAALFVGSATLDQVFHAIVEMVGPALG